VSASNASKILVTVLFVLIGVPPGLCSVYGISGALFQGPIASNPWEYVQWFVVPSLVGFAIFGVMLWWLVATWRRRSP